MAERNFARDEWMSEDIVLRQQGGEPLIGSPQMVYPDGCVDQDHLSFGPPPRYRPQIRFGPAETRQPARRLPLYQGSESLADQRRSLTDTGIEFRVLQQIVVERDSGPHAFASSTEMIIDMGIF